jgi:hypothetical protein
MTASDNENGNGAHVPEVSPLETYDRAIPSGLLDPHGMHAKPFVFPGSDGLPFRGAVPMLKEDDPPERRPQVGSQVRIDVLNLSDAKDLAYYQEIWQVVANGYGQISCEERRYDEDIKSWRVMIRWFLSYAYVPK